MAVTRQRRIGATALGGLRLHLISTSAKAKYVYTFRLKYLHTNGMSAGQLGSPFALIIVKCHTTLFFRQPNVTVQCLEIASSVRPLREHERFVVTEMVFLHQPGTVSSKIQRLAYNIENLSSWRTSKIHSTCNRTSTIT